MKYFITLLSLIFLFTIPTSFAQLTVKDQDATPNTLLQVNDEGNAGSVTLPSLSTIGSPLSKLYNLGGNLYWGSSQLGLAGSAGGWTDGGSIVQLSSITDKVGIGTPAPSTKLHVNGDDGVLFTGLYGSGTTLSLTGGTFLLWYPKKASFRAGHTTADQWSDANIGNYSNATGYNCTASGEYSITAGANSIASGYNSRAFGYFNSASGDNSTAIGYAASSSGSHATSIGFWSAASANYSCAIGYYTNASSYLETVIGRFNEREGTTSSWISTDPIFEIGIGTSSSNKKNALTVQKNGKIGIGTAYPRGELEVAGDDGVFFDGTYGSGTSINFLGSCVNMMWYPKKAAFRAGYQDGTNWDDANIGNYSVAMGRDPKSSGWASISLGNESEAIGSYSIAIGNSTLASGNYSCSLGDQTTSSGYASTSMGYNTSAVGSYSTALGTHTTAGGLYSTTIGSYVQANGEGAFFIGDHSTTSTTTKSEPNRFHARFSRGYYLYSNSTATVGVYVSPGGNSWTSISDSTKKENFKIVNGEDVLEKISKFRLGSWNYIGQNPNTFRHYGPMAQDFYAAFGNDGIGTIGCDTLLSSADFDGINLIAIQALEKRSKTQESRIDVLKTRVQKLEKMITELTNTQNKTRLTSVLQ